MNILIVSESFVIRDSIGNLLKKTLQPADIKIVSNLDGIESKDLSKLDFAFIDVKSENIEVVDTLAKIKSIFKKLRIMILDFKKDKEIFSVLTKMGIDGYILNISEEDEFMYIVKKVLNGKKFYDSELLQYIINRPINYEAQKLTNREFAVLKQVAKGLSNKDIAINLDVTDYTIKKHVSKILSKLNLKNRQDIVIYARDNNLLDNEKTKANAN